MKELYGIKIVTTQPCYKVIGEGMVKIKSTSHRKSTTGFTLEFTFDRKLYLTKENTYKFSINTNGKTSYAQIIHMESGIASIYHIQSQYFLFKPQHTGLYKILVLSNEDELSISSLSIFNICLDTEDICQSDIDNLSQLLNTCTNITCTSNGVPNSKVIHPVVEDNFIECLKRRLQMEN